eukprot:11512785-Alexandrium_andersonii.AAC.1
MWEFGGAGQQFTYKGIVFAGSDKKSLISVFFAGWFGRFRAVPGGPEQLRAAPSGFEQFRAAPSGFGRFRAVPG